MLSNYDDDQGHNDEPQPGCYENPNFFNYNHSIFIYPCNCTPEQTFQLKEILSMVFRCVGSSDSHGKTLMWMTFLRDSLCLLILSAIAKITIRSEAINKSFLSLSLIYIIGDLYQTHLASDAQRYDFCAQWLHTPSSSLDQLTGALTTNGMWLEDGKTFDKESEAWGFYYECSEHIQELKTIEMDQSQHALAADGSYGLRSLAYYTTLKIIIACIAKCCEDARREGLPTHTTQAQNGAQSSTPLANHQASDSYRSLRADPQ